MRQLSRTSASFIARGYTMLASARKHLPLLTPLLMDGVTFDTFAAESAVEEPQPAPSVAPSELSADEAELYQRLQQSDRGRLEQEFLPTQIVHRVIMHWAAR